MKSKHMMMSAAAVGALLLTTPAVAEQWTTDNVRVDQPFGEIDVGMANQDFTAFWNGLREEQRSEFRARCEVIRSSEAYQSSDKALCTNAMTAEGMLPGSGETTGATGSIDQDSTASGTSAAEPNAEAGADDGATGTDNSSGGSAQ